MIKRTSSFPLYDELYHAYSIFNRRLFDGALPDCILTLQRKKGTAGYFSGSQFQSTDGYKQLDEIAINPAYFLRGGVTEVMQTLVHEMVHQWQQHHGKPGRGRYHNKEWSQKMKSIGLMPSSTGEPGGAETGDLMSDYVIEGGLFSKVLSELLTSQFTISWADRCPDIDSLQAQLDAGEDIEDILNEWNLDVDSDGQIVEGGSKSNRLKYQCPICMVSVWGKPELKLLCMSCEKQMEEVE
ncbi:hypothetical protein WH50_06380 [Pokkaliibacter plantistimulans]|uniref:SprT-like domain-containing protein n=1 Tax=Pokkaliibacter plantistimulans TaxID=1635171 RepID=A0ABX5LZH7_9GAMM|nr:SprT-like domain-containing protein [Pokkaliibacter plantistimulans]PXF32081.1 hypothetical protein WH50_06380 [Pokkaliibacter plantistimulans]